MSTQQTTYRPKLPNGFGQITEIKSGNLRNPFRVMVPAGKNEKGKSVVKPLTPRAYFPTYAEAYDALSLYNQTPLCKALTVSAVFDRWFSRYQRTVVSTGPICAAWQYCSSVYDLPISELRARHIKYCMEEGTAVVRGVEKHTNANIQGRIKSLFNLLLDYALEYELVDRNYSRTFKLSVDVVREIQRVEHEHIVFEDHEMKRLWAALGAVPDADLILIQCYSGWRPQELGLIELCNVDLEHWIFTGGMKTEAGKGRMVPIHPRIRPLVELRYHEAERIGSKYLLNRAGEKLTYHRYRDIFQNVISALDLNPSHRPHDCRMHFVTAAKRAGMDEYAIKYIVGHKVSDITERIYTKRKFDWLVEEMARIA